MSSLMSSLILSYHTIPRYNKLTLSATMLFDWSIVFLLLHWWSRRFHTAAHTQPYSVKRIYLWETFQDGSRLSPVVVFSVVFSSPFVSRRCVVVEITPATVSPYSSFSTDFSKIRQVVDVISFVVRFVLQSCVVVEITPATVLSPYSSFWTVFFSKIRQVVASSVSSFALCGSAVL